VLFTVVLEASEILVNVVLKASETQEVFKVLFNVVLEVVEVLATVDCASLMRASPSGEREKLPRRLGCRLAKNISKKPMQKPTRQLQGPCWVLGGRW